MKENKTVQVSDKIRGCLVGGAIGSISAEKMRADPDWARKYIECRKGE